MYGDRTHLHRQVFHFTSFFSNCVWRIRACCKIRMLDATRHNYCTDLRSSNAVFSISFSHTRATNARWSHTIVCVDICEQIRAQNVHENYRWHNVSVPTIPHRNSIKLHYIRRSYTCHYSDYSLFGSCVCLCCVHNEFPLGFYKLTVEFHMVYSILLFSFFVFARFLLLLHVK